MGKRRITWGYPTKKKELAKMTLEQDLRKYKGTVAGLEKRHPRIVKKQHKDGSMWYHIMVDDI